jgi:hypothetical protein
MKKIESYKHNFAKDLLKVWLDPFYLVKLEQKFYFNNRILFIPDLSCYKNNKLISIIEIIHKSDITGKKLGKIQMYQYFNELQFDIFTIYAEWILRQTKRPERLELYNFTTKIWN